MRGNSLRSRLFQAIGVVVLICVAFTIGVGLVLTQRAVKRATLNDLTLQANLIAKTQFGGIGSRASLKNLKPYFKTHHDESYSLDPGFLPASAQALLRQLKPARGTVTYNGTAEY